MQIVINDTVDMGEVQGNFKIFALVCWSFLMETDIFGKEKLNRLNDEYSTWRISKILIIIIFYSMRTEKHQSSEENSR